MPLGDKERRNIKKLILMTGREQACLVWGMLSQAQLWHENTDNGLQVKCRGNPVRHEIMLIGGNEMMQAVLGTSSENRKPVADSLTFKLVSLWDMLFNSGFVT